MKQFRSKYDQRSPYSPAVMGKSTLFSVTLRLMLSMNIRIRKATTKHKRQEAKKIYSDAKKKFHHVLFPSQEENNVYPA